MTIIGAKGHARGLIQVLSENGPTDGLCLFDDVSTDLPDLIYGKYHVIRSLAELQTHFKKHGRDFVLGLGGAKRRRDISEKVKAIGGRLTTLIAGSAQVSRFNCRIADGACVLSNALVGVDVQIGEGTLVNLAAAIAHEVRVGDYCDVAPGAKILGRAEVGELTDVGANVVILPDVKVGANCQIGAGAVVISDVPENAVVVGNPARVLKTRT